MKRNSFTALISIVFVCIVSTVAILTGAWFSDSTTKSVQISMGNAVSITTSGQIQGKTVMPGANIEFGAVKAVASSTTSDMYIRASVSITGDAGTALQITSAGTNWVKIGDYFYYTANKSATSSTKLSELINVSATNETTDLKLTAIINENVTQGSTAGATVLVPGSSITCTVTFQAIQSANTSAYSISEKVNEWAQNA